MKYRITALFSNGERAPIVEYHEDIEKARKNADWMHNNPSLMGVELIEPPGVRLVFANGESTAEYCHTIEEAVVAAKSWQEVVDNRKKNRTRVRKVELLGFRPKVGVATEADHRLGSWMAGYLEDPKVPPSVKFDINCWMDSREWT